MSDEIFEAMESFFIEDDWEFQRMENMPVISMGFSGKNGKWTCYAQARESQQQFVFYSVLPINVPDDKRADMAEFIIRANYGMIVGNFEMDYSDGEVRYKTSIDVEGAELLPALVRQLVYANVIITDRYLPGVMSVIYGGKTPVEAIIDIESDTGSSSSAEDDDGGEMGDLPDLSGIDLSFLDDVDDEDLQNGDHDDFDAPPDAPPADKPT